jgi:hypothetical protein
MPDGALDPGAGKGEPGTKVRAPVAATLNAVTELLNWLLTNSLLSSGLSTTTLELTPGPMNGEPDKQWVETVPSHPGALTATN